METLWRCRNPQTYLVVFTNFKEYMFNVSIYIKIYTNIINNKIMLIIF